MFQITPNVRLLLILNVAIFLLAWFLEDANLFSLNKNFALYQWGSSFFSPYQFVSYLFLHDGFFHLFSNMLGLLVFGATLEQTLSGKNFLILYFVCGIGAGACNSGISYWEAQKVQRSATIFVETPSPDDFIVFINKEAKRYKNPNLLDFMEAYEKNPSNEDYILNAKKVVLTVSQNAQDRSLVGSSGAVFGLITAFALLFPNMKLMLLFPPIPIAAKYMCGLYIAFELFSLYQNNPNDNVAHLAHLFGVVFSILLIKVVWRIPVQH